MTKEIDEPSYYEVALTNRQVLMAFIVILSAVVGSFLCGVWVGQGGTGPLQAQEMRADSPGAAEGEELESFRFFTDEDKEEGEVRKPDLSRLMDEPEKETTLAEDVGSRPNRKPLRSGEAKPAAEDSGDAPQRSAPPPPPAAPPPTAPSPPPPPTPPPSPPPPAKAAAAGDGFIVQVFATHDEAQARKVRSQVEAEGYTAFISPLDQAGGKVYRVRIGPFEEEARAERAARGIKTKFKLETWVTAASN